MEKADSGANDSFNFEKHQEMLNQLPDLNDSDQNVAEMAKNAFMGLQDGVDENPADPNAVQVIDPIAQLLDLGEEIASMKWILNDSFLTVVTTKNNFIVFDSLLNYFNLTLYSSCLLYTSPSPRDS